VRMVEHVLLLGILVFPATVNYHEVQLIPLTGTYCIEYMPGVMQ